MHPRIVIPTKNRHETISTHRYFKDFDYWVLVHEARQYFLYKEHAEKTGLNMDRVIITDTKADQFGLTRQREWACNNILGKNEWFLFADDNIQDILAVDEQHYSSPELPVDKEPAYRAVYNTHCEPLRFLTEIFDNCVATADAYGVHHLGFATVDNFFFRGKKWKEYAYIIGKMMVWRNSGELKFDHSITMEDFELTAQSILKFGYALVNNYVYPVAKHYQAGGMGTMEQRLPDRSRDVEILMKKYPGLLRNKNKADNNPDLAIRYHEKKHIEEWRRQIRFIRGNNGT